MSLSDVSFKMSADGSGALRGINQVRGGLADLNKDLKGEVAESLNGLFKVAFLEEATRRTGEWAEQTIKQARLLGVTTDEMQGLSTMFEHAGVGADKLEGYFDKIEVATAGALSGNEKYIRSLSNLGFKLDDIKKKSNKEIFSELISRRSKFTEEHTNDIGNVFGKKSILDIQAVSKEANGKNVGEYTKEHAEEVVPEGQVSAMGAAWKSIVQDLKAIGVQLFPIMAIILQLVDGLLGMVRGALSYVGSATSMLGNYIMGYINTAISKLTFGKTSQNAAKRAKDFNDAGDQDFLKFYNKGVAADNAFGMHGVKSQGDLTEDDKRNARGARDFAIAAATGGTGAVETSAANTIKATAGVLERAGVGVGKVGAKQALKKGGVASIIATSLANGATDAANATGNISSSDSAPNRNVLSNSFGGILSTMGQDSPNLRVGGVFGAGLQDRLITLTEKQVALLEQIVKNTSSGVEGIDNLPQNNDGY